MLQKTATVEGKRGARAESGGPTHNRPQEARQRHGDVLAQDGRVCAATHRICRQKRQSRLCRTADYEGLRI